MQEQIDMVKTFTQTFKHFWQDHPNINIPGPDAGYGDMKVTRIKFIQEELDELEEAIKNSDLVGILDALTDIQYFVFGTAGVFGLGNLLVPAFTEVQRSNMSKLFPDGLPRFREDGKILKTSPLYSEPDLKNILDVYMKNMTQRADIGRQVRLLKDASLMGTFGISTSAIGMVSHVQEIGHGPDSAIIYTLKFEVANGVYVTMTRYDSEFTFI